MWCHERCLMLTRVYRSIALYWVVPRLNWVCVSFVAHSVFNTVAGVFVSPRFDAYFQGGGTAKAAYKGILHHVSSTTHSRAAPSPRSAFGSKAPKTPQETDPLPPGGNHHTTTGSLLLSSLTPRQTSSPTLHMSASFPYRPTPRTVLRRLSTSGAKYCGVPQNVLRPSLFARLARPKSVIFTSTSLSRPTSRIFSGFRSLS